MREKSLAPVLVQKLAFSLGLYAWFSVFALVLQAQLGFGPVQSSYFFAAFGVVMIVFQLGVVGNLTDRLGTRFASNIGFASAFLFFALIWLGHDLLTVAIIMPLFALGLTVSGATLATLMTDAAPPRLRGTVLGVGSSLESVSGILMPTIATTVLTLYGTSWTASICAFFVFIALALGLVLQRRPVTVAALPAEAVEAD